MQDDIIRQDEGSAVASFIPAIIGGLLGALIGGGIWAAIALITDYEVGYVAIGIGFLAGGGVVLLGKRRGPPYQIIAVIMAIVGLGIGKYLSVFFILRNLLTEQGGAELAASFGITSPEMFELFGEYIRTGLEALDILFIILAIVTAWGMPSNRVPAATAVEKPAGT